MEGLYVVSQQVCAYVPLWVSVCVWGVDAVAGDKSPVLWNALILKFCPLP